MKILKNILIIFIVAIFLASSVGVSFINHVCSSCETSEVKLFANHEHTCSTSDADHCCKTNNENNSLINTIKHTENHKAEHNCCTDEVVIIKIKNLFIPSSYNFDFANIFIFVNYFEDFIINLTNKLSYNFFEPAFVFEKISSPTLSKIGRFIL